MISIHANTFTQVRRELTEAFRSAPLVKTERWQGVVANTDTYELQNVCFEVPLNGIEDLDHWRADILPNLPWADDHFLERVCGEPLNPGVQWANWPYGLSASKFRSKEEEYGPRLSPQDWAYFAGMLDGEGTIYRRKDTPSFQGCIRVYQKESPVLDYLYSIFQVGKVDKASDRTTTMNGKQYDNGCYQWNVSGVLEIRWLLSGAIPYLRVKRQLAEWTLDAIKKYLEKNKETGAPLKKVWGKDWPKRFNHNYMQRFWPRKLDGGSDYLGQNYRYGDLQDVVELLCKEPHTRQAYIPLFFPEDTGLGDGGRKPCTLGYQFTVRENKLHIWYPLRSCDFTRHWQDDCYMAVRLLLWVLDQCRKASPEFWNNVSPGTYAMHMTSLHIFASDKEKL